MATVYAVASAKGGVGKTTTTAAMATILADSGADVVAIDADIGMANLAEAVGVTPGETTLHDVLAGRADPLDAVHEGPAGLRVVPGAADLEAYAAADPSGLREVVATFDDADYVLVDAGAGLSHDSTLPLGLADETLLVSTAERSALGDTEKTRQLTERLGGSVAGAAITRLDPATAADDDPIDAVAETLDAPVLGRIPEDDAVLRAVEANSPLSIFAPDAPATRAYRDLTRALTGAAIGGPGLAAGDAAADDADAAAGEADDSSEADDSEEESEDASIPDAEASGESEETGESEAVPHEADAQGDEDIIVADSEKTGLDEPSDEEDIIVAAEATVEDTHDAEEDEGAEEVAVSESTEDAEPDDDADDSEATGVNTIDGETETVGEEHVDGNDLEAMIEEDLEPETFEDEAADSEESSPDEEVQTDAESEAETDAEPEADSDAEPDDELAGSVPFRDDDTGTRNTALSEEEEEEDDDVEEDEDGGFFSRLLGR